MNTNRLHSLDLLKGLIMAAMALDHASYFIGKTHVFEFWAITLPPYSSSWAFLTRFVTHFCAPGFFFLMGAGMVLFSRSRLAKGWTEGRILCFFLTRGLVLIFLQFLFENMAWMLGFISDNTQTLDHIPVPGGGEGQVWIHMGVLFALGGVMMLLSLIRRAKTSLLLLISVSSIGLSQFLLPAAEQGQNLFSPLLRIFLIPGRTGMMQVYYPLLVCLGVAGLGLVFGRMLSENAEKSHRLAVAAGGIFLLLFVILRSFGSIGSYHPWSGQGWMDFLNVTKYPPSLTFLLLTLGTNLLLLFLFSKWRRIQQFERNPLFIFGRTPLFFYILHLFLYAGLGFFFPLGTGLVITYIFWAAGLAILYPLCLLYGRFKQGTSHSSIWRFF
jgi:uncharacterized membrane protein